MKVSGILLTIAGAILLIASLIMLSGSIGGLQAAYVMTMLGYALLTASGVFLILKK